MPELPEIETIRLALCKLALDRTITKILHVRSDYICAGEHWLNECAPGKVTEVKRRGKFLAIILSNGFALMHHLGMSGRLLLQPGNTPLDKHTHVSLEVDGGKNLLHQHDPRRFGLFAVFKDGELDEYPSWKSLGPEPFDLKPSSLYPSFQKHRRPVKNLLLDQRFIAGLGNIYADETLFRCGIHPLRQSDEVTEEETKKFARIVKTVLQQAIAAGGTSTNDYRHLDGTLGDFQNWLRVYGRDGEPCRKCKSPIKRITLTGRSAHFCPICQS